MPFELTIQVALFAVAVLCAMYAIGACVCRLRYPSREIKHAWKLFYVIMLGLAGWALCDLLSNGHTLFQQVVCVGLAMYIHLTKDAWINGIPSYCKTAS